MKTNVHLTPELPTIIRETYSDAHLQHNLGLSPEEGKLGMAKEVRLFFWYMPVTYPEGIHNQMQYIREQQRSLVLTS